MNLVPTTLQQGAGGMFARLPFLDLPLDYRPTAKVYPPGSELLVGIRPTISRRRANHGAGPRSAGESA